MDRNNCQKILRETEARPELLCYWWPTPKIKSNSHKKKFKISIFWKNGFNDFDKIL